MAVDKGCYNIKCPYIDREEPTCLKDINPDLCEDAILSEDGSKRSTSYYALVFRMPSCACGRFKKNKTGFCYDCFRFLPHEYQHALYRPIRGGAWGEAYERAKEYLIRHGKIEK